jgi:5-methylcytosine-specific restriction endonuclease McrA
MSNIYSVSLGGSSFEPYSVDWTDTLKKSIRERDRYTCQICGKEPSICVHHIDYNKKNCNPDNLITLCVGCHSKTNHSIDKWINYFKSERKGY